LYAISGFAVETLETAGFAGRLGVRCAISWLCVIDIMANTKRVLIKAANIDFIAFSDRQRGGIVVLRILLYQCRQALTASTPLPKMSIESDLSKTNEPKGEKFLSAPLLLVFLTIFIDLVGFGIVIPLLTFYAVEFNATPLDVGLIVASYSLMQFIFSPIWGALSDRIGRRPILFLTILGSVVGYLILGTATALWMVYFGRILSGVMGGNLATAQAYIADVTTRENRARGMGLFGMAFGLGFIIGPALAGVLSKFGMHVPFLFAAGLSLINAVLVYFVLPESLKPGAGTDAKRGRIQTMFDAFRDTTFAMIATKYFLIVMAFSMMTTSFAYFTLVQFGYDAEKTGYLLGFVGLLSALMQGGVFGRVAKRFGEVKTSIFGSAMLVISLIAVPYVSAESGGLTFLLIGIALFAIGNSLASPALTSLASKSASESDQGSTLGVLQSSASLARVIGPLLTGYLLNNAVNGVDRSTLFRTYWAAAAIMFGALVTGFLLLKKAPKHQRAIS
jgi:MFS transporter, DHA1 family, tetracycline resistance protein